MLEQVKTNNSSFCFQERISMDVLGALHYSFGLKAIQTSKTYFPIDEPDSPDECE